MLNKCRAISLKYFLCFYRRMMRPDIVKHHGIKIPIGPEVSDVIRTSIYWSAYEDHEVRTLKQVLKQTDSVLDIGAGIGFVSSFIAKEIGSDNVIVYEANPKLIPAIKNTFAHNNVSPALKNKILSNNNGSVPFYVCENFWSSSTVRRYDSDQKIEVETEDINTVISSRNITTIVMDIEGGEAELFSKINDYSTIERIIFEIHPHVIGQAASMNVIKTLIEKGFFIDFNYVSSNVLFFEKIKEDL